MELMSGAKSEACITCSRMERGTPFERVLFTLFLRPARQRRRPRCQTSPHLAPIYFRSQTQDCETSVRAILTRRRPAITMQGDEGRVNREMPQEAGTIGKVQEVPCWSVDGIYVVRTAGC